MSNPALQWISEAYQGGYLRAAFIDCQNVEYDIKNEADFPPEIVARYYDELTAQFSHGQYLATNLRDQGVPISHFMLDETGRGLLEPFKYKNRNKKRIPKHSIDFKIVIPAPNDWIYPKETFNGFENDNAEAILDTGDEFQRSVLIGAGFTARCCLQETLLGSFERAKNRLSHKVIVALGATNLDPQYYKGYQAEFLAAADECDRDSIGFITNNEAQEALNTITNPLQSSQRRPYRASKHLG